MRKLLLVTGACALLAATAAAAQKPGQDRLPPQIEQLLACRAIAETSQRLACFDQHSAAVDQAIGARDIVMIDREQARQTKRSLFGFSVPDFGGIFGGGGEDEVKEIESDVAAVRRNHEGGWMVRLADGSTWSQTDDTPVAIAPRKGHKAVVRRGSFGVFYLRLNDQPGVRVQRVG